MNNHKYFFMFLAHGGTFVSSCYDVELTDTLMTKVIRFGGFEFLSNCLFRQSEPWLLDDMPLIDRWLVGTFMYTNKSFRARMNTYLNIFQSSFSKARRTLGTDINMIVSQVLSAPSDVRVAFIELISLQGNISMLEPFIDAGIHVNDGGIEHSFLGSAALFGNLETFDLLLQNGADTALGISHVFRRCTLPKGFEYCLLTMINRTTSLDIGYQNCDLVSELCSLPLEHTWKPPVLAVLLDRGLFNNLYLVGSASVPLSKSYVFNAIDYKQTQLLQLLLDRGVDMHSQLGDQFDCSSHSDEPYQLFTWLTLAVNFGYTSCLEILVKYSDIHLRDGNGWSALELARHHAAVTHPRVVGVPMFWATGYIAADTDDKTLAVLQTALARQPMSSSSHQSHVKKTIPSQDLQRELNIQRSWGGNYLPTISISTT